MIIIRGIEDGPLSPPEAGNLDQLFFFILKFFRRMLLAMWQAMLWHPDEGGISKFKNLILFQKRQINLPKS
jgi:hypothetical protein